MSSPAPLPEMACQELVEVITDYLERTLDARDQLRFDAHLAECDACADYLAQMRRTIELVGRLDVGALPADTRAELLHVFRDWRAAS